MFPCSGCGLCCQNISNVQELKSYDLGNGVCKYFDRVSNGCNIYDTRPDICRVDKMFELVYHKEFGLEAFYIANASVCNALQESYKIDTSFRITIGEK
jgi:Fe-S-cluster containining protein